MIWGHQQESIIFIKSLEELEQPAVGKYDRPFVFANYKVVDKTCNKELKYAVSLNKAEARKQRQLAYKKHANCEVVIEELHLLDDYFVTLNDVYGSDKSRNVEVTDETKLKDILVLKNNINMRGTVQSIKTDKDIETRNGPTRMMKIIFEDEESATMPVTIWGEMATGIKEGCKIEMRNAAVNIYNERFEGLQISKSGSVKILSTPEPVKLPDQEILPEDGMTMKLVFNSLKNFEHFRVHVSPEIRDEDVAYIDFVKGSMTLKNPSRYSILGMKITELGSMEREPRTVRIDKIQGVMKDNPVVVGVLNDGPYGAKGTQIVENFSYEVMKDDENKAISYMDKYSYECAQCHEKFGYKRDAEGCSRTHIPYGKMLGEYVMEVELTKI